MKAVNLLPSDHRGAAKASKASPAAAASSPGGSSFGAYAVLGALALVVVMVAAYTLVGNSVKDRTAELARVQADSQAARSQADALKPYHDFQQMAEQRVATVTQLAQSRFDWERSLRDVSRALPGDVRLKSLKGSVSEGAGSGGSALRGQVSAPAIELSGCTKSQSGVARLMGRLRAVRGVTRVSLAKSDKGEGDAGGTAATTAVGQGPLCGKGSPPAFELVMFFERSLVAPPSATLPAPNAAAGTPAPNAAAGTPAQPATGQAQSAQPSTSGQTQGVSAP
jgi:Tfp pilus assembly protein PilN